MGTTPAPDDAPSGIPQRGGPGPGSALEGTGASAPANPHQDADAPASVSPASSAPVPGRPVRGSAGGRPVMAALDLLGRRWTLRVIWELHRNGAPVGFRDLQRRCDDMSSSVLSTRLTELREAGIAAPTSTAAQPAWHLTALGDDLVTAMGPLLDWSHDWAARR